MGRRVAFTLCVAALLLTPAAADAARSLNPPAVPARVQTALAEAQDSLFEGLDIDADESETDPRLCVKRQHSWLCFVDLLGQDGWFRVPVSISTNGRRWRPLLGAATFTVTQQGQPCVDSRKHPTACPEPVAKRLRRTDTK